jgi:threonine dehydrogenase-like Zn-dependent dehydrogenase
VAVVGVRVAGHILLIKAALISARIVAVNPSAKRLAGARTLVAVEKEGGEAAVEELSGLTGARADVAVNATGFQGRSARRRHGR